MNEDAKKQLDQLGDIIDAKIEKASGQAIESATGKADQMLKNEIANLVEKFNERMDAIEVSNKKMNVENETKSFKGALNHAIKDGAIDSIRKGHSRSAKFEVKADMTIAADFTGDVIPAQRVPGYKFDPTRSVHVRQLIPVGSTTSDVVRFVKESGYSNGVAPKNEGAALAQSDFDMTATDANTQKIGTYFRISEEMLNDTPQLTSYLSSRAPEKLLQVEDTQILNGDGNAPNLSGIITDAADFAAGGFANAIESANEFDVLTCALNQLSLANYTADYIMMNPTDFHKILLLKASTNEYLVKDWNQGLQPRINGVPVILTTAITSDKYLLGNFGVGTQLWVRDNVSVEFFREDGTNVQDGFVTVRCQERVALTNYLPNAFVNGDFSVDKAALETS
ncbi:MAG: putative major capsid protein [Prokaryotic dsDNA virus sp.]|jgi:HK97 family phage major capsid protein|nr:MAG: putative major capsid protein [Prokaryotic dsDNA virus sp.]|tara:strand:+ start:3531 stop:4715 length:1185 start_codon:yes stop_codon:yes gene_type:complete